MQRTGSRLLTVFKRGNDEARVNGVNGSAVVGRSLHYRGLSKSQLQLDSLY